MTTRPPIGRVVDVVSLAAFDALVARGALPTADELLRRDRPRLPVDVGRPDLRRSQGRRHGDGVTRALHGAAIEAALDAHYADEATIAPIVRVGVEHWSRRMPAWPLLEALARDRAMAHRVALVDSVEEAADLLAGERWPTSS